MKMYVSFWITFVFHGISRKALNCYAEQVWTDSFLLYKSIDYSE